MLPFFKKKDKNIQKQGEDSTVSANEVLGTDEQSHSNVEVKTELSFHPSSTVGVEEKYYYQFLNNELSPLKENQVSLSGIELKNVEDGYVVSAFVRNSLNKSIHFNETALLLIGPDGERLARKVFNLKGLGNLPARSSRPWEFHFEEQHVIASELPSTGWRLAFEIKKPHALDLEESWEKSLADQDKKMLAKLVQETPAPKPGEVNFMSLQAKQAQDGSLHVTMLIRNGSPNHINLEKLPLIVEDATGEVIAKGGFTLNSLQVKANTSKPWTFIFPPSLLLKEQIDLQSWKAYPQQNEKANQK
ncbi:accessory Sec system S-layer assembly protein [Bacillus sp. SCS-151]|uniref:accessory Sec system S-layer assembly protein n=1 Tax=Nanhaiella sioensis TaxID=3115293 RepID=UPI003977EAC1